MVGTELKLLLGKLRLYPKGECDCDKYAKLMDSRGIPWCHKNIELLVDVLEESAEKRGLPFKRFVGKLLILHAIKRAKRSEQNEMGLRSDNSSREKIQASPTNSIITARGRI